MEPILKTAGLWKTYRSGKLEVPALRGVNFEVLPGEFVAVMGTVGVWEIHLAARGRRFGASDPRPGVGGWQ